MLTTSEIGYIGEMQVLAALVKQGWTVFTDTSGKCAIDLIIYRDREVKTVQVKTSSSRTPYNTGWVVELKSSRSNKTITKINNFDNSAQDILAVYLPVLNKVLLFNSNSITQKTAFVIKDEDIMLNNGIVDLN